MNPAERDRRVAATLDVQKDRRAAVTVVCAIGGEHLAPIRHALHRGHVYTGTRDQALTPPRRAADLAHQIIDDEARARRVDDPVAAHSQIQRATRTGHTAEGWLRDAPELPGLARNQPVDRCIARRAPATTTCLGIPEDLAPDGGSRRRLGHCEWGDRLILRHAVRAHQAGTAMARCQEDLLVVPQGGEAEGARRPAGTNDSLDLYAALHPAELVLQGSLRYVWRAPLDVERRGRDSHLAPERPYGRDVTARLHADDDLIRHLIEIEPQHPWEREHASSFQPVAPVLEFQEGVLRCADDDVGMWMPPA